MVSGKIAASSKKPVSLLILEGETEEVFYSIVRDKYLSGLRVKLTSIKGQGNINRQILAKLFGFLKNNTGDLVRGYCCIDTERGKNSATPLDVTRIKKTIIEKGMRQVLGVEPILADPEIESWFFYDIDGIYRFLKTPNEKRNTRKYSSPKNYGKKELQDLFHRFGDVYLPGKRARNFIEHLDMAKIATGCKELCEGIKAIKRLAENGQNNIFNTL